MEFEQQLVSSLLLASISKSDPRGCARSHVCAQLRSAAHLFGWQSRKLILKAGFDFSQNLASLKITRHTLLLVLVHVSIPYLIHETILLMKGFFSVHVQCFAEYTLFYLSQLEGFNLKFHHTNDY